MSEYIPKAKYRGAKNEQAHLVQNLISINGKVFDYLKMRPKAHKIKRLTCNQCHHEFGYPKKLSTRNAQCPECQWHNCQELKQKKIDAPL